MTRHLRLALGVILLLVAGSHAWHESRPVIERESGSTSHWVAHSPAGVELRARADTGAGLALPGGSTLRLQEEDHDLHRVQAWTLQLGPAAEGEHLEFRLRFRESRGGYILRLLAEGGHEHAQLAVRTVAGSDIVVASAVAPLVPDGGQRTLIFSLSPERLAVQTPGGRRLGTESDSHPEGWMDAQVLAGTAHLRHISARGTRSQQHGNFTAFEWGESPGAVGEAAPHPVRARARVALILLGLLLLLADWVALLRGDVPWLAAAEAVLWPAVGAAVSAAIAATLVPAQTVLAAVVGALLGLPVAGFRLTSAGGGPSRPRIRAWPLAVALLLGVFALAGERVWVEQQRLSKLGELGATAAVLDTPTRVGPQKLGPHNSLVVPGAFRDLRLHARVTLSPDAILGLRLRATGTRAETGTLLELPADPRLRARVWHEGLTTFEVIGSDAPALPAAREVRLEVELRGQHLLSRVDGQRSATCNRVGLVPGQVVAMALRGHVQLHELTVEALPPAPLPSAAAAVAERSLGPALLFLVLAGVLARLVQIPLRTALVALAFATLPLLDLLWQARDMAGIEQAKLQPRLLAGAVLAAAGLLLATPRPRLGLAAAALLAAFALPATLRATQDPSTLLAPGSLGRMTILDAADLELHGDLAWLHHPLVRRWNEWHARHEFRDRVVRLRSPPGTDRVLCLGGSGTYGWRLPAEQRLEWPARLGPLVGTTRPCEVVNAGVIGATSARMLPWLREVLLEFRPDVVVLCMFFNDSTALSQGDEVTYLGALDAADSTPGWWDRLRWERQFAAERAFTRALAHEGSLRRADTAERWRAARLPGWPPQRFGAVLTEFARLAAEHDFALVLVKEPIAGDGPYLWKQEFQAQMDAVGSEFGLPVVDPSPALQAAGGAELFFDDVHLKPAGHAAVAEVLAPIVSTALQQRRARAPTAGSETNPR